MAIGDRIEKPWGHAIVVAGLAGPEEAPVIKKRREWVLDEDFSIEPASLVGSCFLVLLDRTPLWQGVVVAEPQAGRYLCELDRLEEGAEKVQRLFSLDTLMGLGDEGRRLIEGAMGDGRAPVVEPNLEWQFFDTEDAARSAYAKWVAKTGAEA